jgi:uncharacterized protein (DUF433 family)
MTKKELLSRISIDPNICFGKPCIRGHRIWKGQLRSDLRIGFGTPAKGSILQPIVNNRV